MISRVNSEFNNPTLMEKSKNDGRHCSVITPAKFGGSKQVRETGIVCLMDFFLFCFRVCCEFYSNEIDFIEVKRHFGSISVKSVDNVHDNMLLLCFAEH